MSTLGNHKLLFRKGPRELTRVNSASPLAGILSGFQKKANMDAIIKPVRDVVSSVPGKVRNALGSVHSTVGDQGASVRGAQQGFSHPTTMAGSGDKIKNTGWGKGKVFAGAGLAAAGLSALAAYKTYKAFDRTVGNPAPTQEW